MNNKELAFRYDLFITPDWRDRFDTLVNESTEFPVEGRILDVNCGTGAHAIELAETMRGKAEVVGVDPDPERIALARAKALVQKSEATFEQGFASALRFENRAFNLVIGDASMLREDQIDPVLAEMVRVTASDGQVLLKLTTHGSFDEFFSIYWEALHEDRLDVEAWGALEELINERRTYTEAETMAERLGLRNIESVTSKEDFSYEDAETFLESPLIKDYFLAQWLGILPLEKHDEVRRHIVSIIERERHDGPFEISIKATIVMGTR
jgi:ubiquinone/menaquinone biosynthesis C-methylase UbiE